jgi:hypothetical protein
MAFNTKALLNVGATSTGPIFINSAVCWQAPLGADNLADLYPLRAKAFAERARVRAALFTQVALGRAIVELVVGRVARRTGADVWRINAT